VVKADGLAAGKGVSVCQTVEEALAAIHAIMEERVFGPSGDAVVIEEILQGEEATFMALTDGRTALPLATSQDHKRVGDGDVGANTGGMGAYSPAPIVEGIQDRIMQTVIHPVLSALRETGVVYKGLLYAGLMVQDDQVKVLEFNVRFGDPECQAILMRMESDLVDLLEAVVEERLAETEVRWRRDASTCVVLCEQGYPGPHPKGTPISGLEGLQAWDRGVVFHAGTERKGTQWVTNGGRVLGVTAVGPDLEGALSEVYCAVKQIRWDGMHYRRDIGARALAEKGQHFKREGGQRH
jgi:phosphoribosylamine--glycine ligase